MKFDKLSLFADGITVPDDANTTTYSKVIDFRKCDLIDGFLKIYAQVVGTVNSSASGQVTTKLQVSADGTTWTDLVSFTQNGQVLAAAFLPIVGKKRYARLAFAVGSTALSADIVVRAGLVDQFNYEELPAIQTFASDGSGLVDGTNDAMSEALTLSASSGTITKGLSGTVTVKSGFVTTYTVPTGYTLTQSGATITIALASTANTGNVVLVDGLGNKLTYAVTAAAAG